MSLKRYKVESFPHIALALEWVQRKYGRDVVPALVMGWDEWAALLDEAASEVGRYRVPEPYAPIREWWVGRPARPGRPRKMAGKRFWYHNERTARMAALRFAKRLGWAMWGDDERVWEAVKRGDEVDIRELPPDEAEKIVEYVWAVVGE